MDVSILAAIAAVLAAIVAVLAAVGAPWVSLHIANRQIRSSLEVSNKQIIAPMRQAWIDKLRELLAEFTSRTTVYYYTDLERFSAEDGQRLSLLETHIRLMLNPNEKDHKHLEMLMREIMGKILSEKKSTSEFEDLRSKIIALSREIMKHEWQRVKSPIPVGASRPQS